MSHVDIKSIQEVIKYYTSIFARDEQLQLTGRLWDQNKTLVTWPCHQYADLFEAHTKHHNLQKCKSRIWFSCTFCANLMTWFNFHVKWISSEENCTEIHSHNAKMYLLKGVLHPLPQNLHVLCSISKLSTPFWKIIYASYSILFKELKNSTTI